MNADPLPLWRNRPFSIFWTAQLLSYAGSQVSEFAIPLIAVLTLRAAAGQMGVLGAAELLPPLVLSLVAGVVVDRFRRASVMLWSGLGQAVLLATIPLGAVAGVLTLPQLYAVAFLTASLALGYRLAATAYIPLLVDRRQLVSANSAMTMSDSVPSVTGPGLAGILVQLLTAPIAVAADVASFLVAAALLLAARRPEPEPAAAGRLTSSFRDGFVGFVRRPGVWAPTAAMGTHALFYGGILALLVLYAVRDLGLTPAQLGLVYAVAAAGPILASAVAGPATRHFGFRWMSVPAAALFAGNLLVPLAAGPTVVVLAFLVAGRGLVGLGAVFLSVTRTSVMQDSVPPDLVGRVNAVVHLVEWGPLPLGSLLGGLLGQALGLRPALFILATAGMASVLWVLLAALQPAQRAGAAPR